MAAANSKAKTAMPLLLHRSPTLPRTRIGPPFPRDHHSLDETIDLPMDE
jgi:hypothetical protein